MQVQADRMQGIPFSSIRQVFEQVNRLTAEGRDVIPLHIGRPDFDTPAHIKAAAQQALEDGLTAYTSNYGLPALRGAIADKLLRDNGLTVDPDREVIVTVGSNEAIMLAMLATLNPGDEVLAPDPMWGHYRYCARLAGADTVGVPLRAENGYQPDPADVRARITPRTRMIIVNSPHNPTGAVFSREVLGEIAEIAAEHDLLILSDEIYEQIVYDGSAHISVATIEPAASRTITINGFSKAYAMTGWRIGYVTANPDLIGAMLRVHQYTTVCATSFAQAGAVAALTGPQGPVREMVAAYAERRQAIVDAFAALPGADLPTPGGAFYAFPRLPHGYADSAQFCEHLLHEGGVAAVPGAAFGEYGEGHFRLSYACSLPDVRRAMAVLKTYWEE